MPNNAYQQPVYLQSGLPQRELRPQDAYSGGELGSRFVVRDPEDSLLAKGYQLVITDSVMDTLPSNGATAWWADKANYRVTTKISVAGRGNRAGIFLRAATAAEIALTPTPADGRIGAVMCVQQKGRHRAVQIQTGTPSAAGLFVIPSATDGKADVLASGASATFPIIGLSASVLSGSTCQVDLDIDDQV